MRYAITAAALIAWASPSQAFDCEKLLKMHGFLSRAQFQCGFSKYSKAMMADAKECNAHLNDARVKETVTAGMKLFDVREKERGHDQMCSDVLRSFPNDVSR